MENYRDLSNDYIEPARKSLLTKSPSESEDSLNKLTLTVIYRLLILTTNNLKILNNQDLIKDV